MADPSKVCTVCKNPKPDEKYWGSPYCQKCHDNSHGYEMNEYKNVMFPPQQKTHYVMCYICLNVFELSESPYHPITRKLCVDCYKMIASRNVKKKK